MGKDRCCPLARPEKRCVGNQSRAYEDRVADRFALGKAERDKHADNLSLALSTYYARMRFRHDKSYTFSKFSEILHDEVVFSALDVADDPSMLEAILRHYLSDRKGRDLDRQCRSGDAPDNAATDEIGVEV